MTCPKEVPTALLLLLLAAAARAQAPVPQRSLSAGAYGGSLQAALAAVGGAEATVVADVPLRCDVPAIPANVEVTVPRGSLLLLPESGLKVDGTLTAGRYRIFSTEGSVTGLKDPCPEWFGAGARGATDDTVAVQRAIDSVGDRPGSRVILGGRYAVTSLLVSRFGSTIQSDNAWLIARPGKADYLLRFAPSAHSASLTGNLFIDLDYNLGYGCAINVNARHFTAYSVNMWRAPLGWLIGDPKWATSGAPGDAERGDSEIEIIGCSTAHCLRAVEAVGANTIVKFTGSLLYSFPWTLKAGDPRKAAWEAADATAIRAVGALIYIDSGAVANFSNKPLIDVQPVATTAKEYFSEYGKVFLSSAHVESGNLFAATNPHGIVSRGWANSLSMLGCNGYLSSDNPVIVTDPLFTGGVLVRNCAFYRAGRTSPLAVIANPAATVDLDPGCFPDRSPRGLNAVQGGTQKFTGRMILQVQGAAGSVTASGAVVRFRRLTPLPDGANFETCYNPATGVFTCPRGGLQNVTVRAAVATADGRAADVAELAVLRNTRPVFLRQALGYGGEIEYTIAELKQGDQVAVRMTARPPRRLAEGVGTYLQITASRY